MELTAEDFEMEELYDAFEREVNYAMGMGEQEEEEEEEEVEEAVPAVEVEANQSGSEEEEEGSEEEEEEEERGAEECVGARVSDSEEKAGAAAAESVVGAERPYLPNCPVCMEVWTADGPHRVSCIPCGHVYGRSCLERWLVQCRNRSATCPQCGRRFKEKNIINLYAPEIVVPNNDLEKQVLALREKNESLVRQQQELLEEISEQKRQIMLQRSLLNGGSSKRQRTIEYSSHGTTDVGSATSLTADVSSSNLCRFVLQNEISLDGARVMGIDASRQIILASGRAPGVGGEHVLTKISMFAGRKTQKIHLPPNTKAIRDICILPDGCAIFASLGRKLSLLSMTTNSIVLQYDLPAPSWSCSGDKSNSNHIYAGLQNGMLLVFDIRQTAAPLHSMMGLSTHPVHTIHSIIDSIGSRKVLSASSIGPCMWDTDGNPNRPSLLIGMENQGVCISLACAAPSSDTLVASFRPKVEMSADATTSQVFPSQSPTLSGSGKLGHHVLIRRTSDASFAKDQIYHGSVSELRMSKSVTIPCENDLHLFAYGDESLYRVRTWQLPSFQMFADLKPHHRPILDLRYAESSTGERYLGSLSEEKLQVFKIG